MIDIHNKKEIQLSTFYISHSEKEKIKNLLIGINSEYENKNFEHFFHSCYQASFLLPENIKKIIYTAKELKESQFIFKNLPVSKELSKTPDIRSDKYPQSSLSSRKMMCLILSQLGFIYKYKKKKHADFIDDVFPIKKDRHTQTGTNKNLLKWHVEDGFHTAKADWIALFCLRSDPTVKTYLFKAKNIDLDNKYMHELRKRNFILESDTTFNLNKKYYKKISVLSEHNDPEIIYDPHFMTCCTREAQTALKELHAFIEAHKQSITLNSGDLLLFDNRRVIHSRSSYEPRYDGSDRWLLRANILESKFKARDCFSQNTLQVN